MQPAGTRLPTEARRAEIVAAAVRLAQERSPAAITTTDLASAVGLSQGALFKHFPSKEAVWLAVMAWVAEHLLRSLDEAAQQAATPLDALRSVFDAHVEFVVTFPGVPRLIFHELQQPLDSPVKRQTRDLLQGYRQLLLRLLQAAVQRGDVPADLDAPAAATLFVGIVQGLVMQSMLGGQISTMRVEAPRIFHLYLRGIRPLP
ncbi:TetR/AcrR family transcriptional regulator [Rhodoferax ferrireducens]|uniref:TetR/AcrR family transcriptional regulator n=1 Tax=Rhodoferax ferrireducens TaxID=192843 RepID=UPI000E0CC21B|nr:TetR/AcrR family transcriptional regulator [Rhodoferax ferrireducens]